MLKVIKHIKKHGIENTVAKFKLKIKEYDQKVLLKYDQIDSPMGEAIVQECRGIILEKGTWDVMCLSFLKFFNSGEGHAASINWNTAKVLEKCDGSMIQVYWDWNKNCWFAATTGTAEGEAKTKSGIAFNDLFWDAVDSYPFNKSLLNKDYIYVFELMTPHNIVVTPHKVSQVSLLAVRNRDNLKELSWGDLEMVATSINIPLVKAFDMNVNNVEDIKHTFDGMPFTEEGYVVVDANHNRIKIKNPAYVAAHHMKSKTSDHAIMDVVKSNEIEEFAATFPEKGEEIFYLYGKYIFLISKLEEMWEMVKIHAPIDNTADERKKFAIQVFKVIGKDYKAYSGFFFSMNDGKVKSAKEYMMNYDNKKLYSSL